MVKNIVNTQGCQTLCKKVKCWKTIIKSGEFTWPRVKPEMFSGDFFKES
jgi:hypothetical protein